MSGPLRSSSMVFTESRNRLKPVKNTSKSNIPEDTKKNMLLRAKKLSLDSDSLMKSLQGKYEQKEPKPPPLLGLGVRRYKGSKSALGRDRLPSLDSSEDELDHNMNIRPAEKGRKKSIINGHGDPSMDKIKEETEDKDEEPFEVFDNQVNNEEQLLAEIEEKMKEIEVEADRVFQSLEEDDLELSSSEKQTSNNVISAVDAASNGDISALKRFLLEGGDVNSADHENSTPIEAACANGHAFAVRLIAKNGGDVTVVDHQGRSLLHTAILGGQNKMVAVLVEAGSKGDSRDHRRGRTPLHIATVENELVMIKMLIQALKDDPWAAEPILSLTDKDGRTPLHIAAGSGRVEAAKLLLSVGFSVTRKDLYGQTPMHAALGLNHTNKRCRQMLRLLLEAGGDLAIKEEHPTDGEDFQSGRHIRGEDIEFQPQLTANEKRRASEAVPQNTSELEERRHSSSSVLCRRRSSDAWVDEQVEQVERMIHTAARIGCDGCLQLLVKYGAPVNSRDRRERTPLHLAAESGRPKAVVALAKLGAELDVKDSRGHTPLHSAINADSASSVKSLLDVGANKQVKDPIGRSYAEFALLSRKADAFRALIKEGVFDVGEEGSSILHSCASVGCLTSTQLLLDVGWDVNVANKDGVTPLHTTIGQGHEDIATLLVTEGANIMTRDKKGATPLHYAVRWGGSDALLRLLVKRGASLSAQDRLGRTPLHYAASKFAIMSDLYILLGGGAGLNPADISGLTPLHLAARLGNESLVRILLDKGANPNVKDMYNFTAWDHAKENGHCSIMKRLEDYMAPSDTEPEEPKAKSVATTQSKGRDNCDAKAGDKPNAEGRNITDTKNEQFKSTGKRLSVAW